MALDAYNKTKKSGLPPPLFKVLPDDTDFCYRECGYFHGKIVDVLHGLFHLVRYDTGEFDWEPLEYRAYFFVLDDAAPEKTRH